MRKVLAAALLGFFVGGAALADAPPSRPGFDPQAYAENRFGRLFATSGRYMEMGGVCQEPTLNFPGWTGAPVMQCTYKTMGVTTDVWMLNADAARLAKWSVSACTAIATRNMRGCLDAVANRIWGASNGQFPVAGFVVEPASAVGARSAAPNTPYCSLMRNGVTINVAGYRTRPARNGSCGLLDLVDDPATWTGQFARPASTTRAHLTAAGVTDAMAGAAFGDVVGRLYREAWNADDNVLITAWAKAAKRAGELR